MTGVKDIEFNIFRLMSPQGFLRGYDRQDHFGPTPEDKPHIPTGTHKPHVSDNPKRCPRELSTVPLGITASSRMIPNMNECHCLRKKVLPT